MTQLLDRNRLYALVGSLEDDLRDLMRRYLLEDADEQEILGPAYNKAAERFLEDPEAPSVGADIFDYLDLGDEIAVLNRFRNMLPAGIQDALAATAGRLDQLVGIRNRVMHRRPLLPDDYDNASRWLDELDGGGFSGDNLRATLRHLREDPSWSPTSSYESSLVSAVMNNLPIPDFDETGLIGRRKQVERVKRLLLQRRFPVLTLTGPGGIGKTAVALQVLHELAEDVDSPYDLIAWVSLKTEQLTAAGVQVIRDAVNSIEQAVPSLAAPLDTSFAGGIVELAQSFEGIDAVLAIDNLETVSATEVVALVDELPSTVTCLFTSRVGLGEIERREVLGPLEMPYAVDFFRRLARARQLDHLSTLNEKRIQEVLGILGTSPLAIKWFVLAVEAGQAPDTILRQQTDLIRFCVQNVYQGLSERAKDAAVVLAHVNRPLTVQDLKLYFPETAPDELRLVMQELLRRSLCNISMADESILERFQATDALVEYLRIVGGASDDFLERVQRTEDEYRKEEERLRLEQGRTPLRVNVISGSSEHRASALRLRDALSASAKDDTASALRIIDEVEQLEPLYWELFRVRGFILSQLGRVEDATTAYERALALAPDAEAQARVRFFYAGHLTRRVRDPETALVQAKEAHKVLQRYESALELGKALTYVRDFSSAIGLLRYACTTSDIRGQLIAGTQLVDTLRRRAEVEANDLRSPVRALETLNEALNEGCHMLSSGVRDPRLEEQLFECIADALNAAVRLPQGEERNQLLRTALSAMRELPRGGIGTKRQYLVRQAARLLTKPGLPPDVIDSLTELGNLHLDEQGVEAESTLPPTGLELAGRVKAWKPERRFGFITAIDGSGDYFFHALDLENPVEQIFIERGLVVLFTPTVTREGRRARMVNVREVPDDALLKRRALTVHRVSYGYLLAADDLSGVTVFIGRHAMRDQEHWDAIQEGDTLIGDVEPTQRDRLAAVPGSVVLGEMQAFRSP